MIQLKKKPHLAAFEKFVWHLVSHHIFVESRTMQDEYYYVKIGLYKNGMNAPQQLHIGVQTYYRVHTYIKPPCE